jgi:hypothetical protein
MQKHTETGRVFSIDRKTLDDAEWTDTSPSVRDGLLDSWKEIAAFLGREVRTVQLWEKREGLPVHRHFHVSRASVHAFRSELVAWRESRRTVRHTQEHSSLIEAKRVHPSVAVVTHYREASL